MTKQSLASLCIKLMAVYVIVSYISALPQNMYLLYQGSRTTNVWISSAMVVTSFMVAAIWLGIGLLFIRFADSIARKLVPEDEDADVISVSSGDSLYKVVFVCLGMLLTVQALPYVIRIAMIWHMGEKYDFDSERYFYQQILPQAVCFATQIGLGVFLMIRPETVLRWIKKFQPRGNSSDYTH